jgi:glycosyltransferase involved in cell wall biosynthesis
VDMKILHVPFTYWPDPVGGTEVYVRALARHLEEQGVSSAIAAPASQSEEYFHDDIPVYRFEFHEALCLPGENHAGIAEAFGRILDKAKPDLVHLHASVSLGALSEARRRGIPMVFTYHTPVATCARLTLMRWGTEVCDGRLDVRRCSRCTLHARGLNKAASMIVGSLPIQVGRIIAAAKPKSRAAAGLRMTQVMAARHDAIRALMSEVHTVVSLCAWTRELLIRNGVSPDKIKFSRQGLCHPLVVRDRRTREDHSRMRIAFLGRLDSTKGTHVLVRAVRECAGLPIDLDVYGIVRDVSGALYLDDLRKIAGDDPRIKFHEPLAADQVVPVLTGYDILAAPSLWLETGPLVVLEAFAAGIPVLGSQLGGIAELVRHGIDGLLVAPGSVEQWTKQIRDLCNDRGKLARLRAGVRPPKTMQTVAHEMEALYHNVCSIDAYRVLNA